LKIALKYSAYSLIPTPISVQKKLPGNIGDGISSDANKNKKTKAMRITAPLIVDYLSEGILNMFCFLVDISKISNIAIFNKSYCLPVRHEYKDLI
jgi:hypothetical protein